MDLHGYTQIYGWRHAGLVEDAEGAETCGMYLASGSTNLIKELRSYTVKIPLINFDKETHQFLHAINVVQDQLVPGSLVFERYKSIIKREDDDFLKSKVDLKKIGGILSNFSINVYPTILSKLSDKLDKGENGQFGFEYLLHQENGFDFSNELEDIFI